MYQTVFACLLNVKSCACDFQVIDAEMARRKLLEESPIASTQEEPVLFDTSEIPWWAWVRRFHLPEVYCLYALLILGHLHMFPCR